MRTAAPRPPTARREGRKALDLDSPATARSTPERRCLACGRRAPKADLARFVAAPAGNGRALARDDGGRLPGRGLYVCRARACFERAVARRSFRRAARLEDGELAIDPALGAALDDDEQV